jgi:hypothetical protein
MIVLHKVGDVRTVRSMFPSTSHLSGAQVKIEKLERNTDGKINGVALVSWLSDSDTHKILPKGESHIGTSILV